jgi:hypothetical protein
MLGQVDGHPNFNDTIKPMTSRWFEFASFTWLKPDTPVSSLAAQVATFHREIIHIPFAPWANLVASASSLRSWRAPTARGLSLGSGC